MKIYGGRSTKKTSLLILALIGALASCDKSIDRPLPPHAPPKPQALPRDVSKPVQKAVFSYSSAPAPAKGAKRKVPRHGKAKAIRT